MAGVSSIGASCPKGGSFYTCQNSSTEFVGCCTSDPCTSEAGGKCPQNNLRAATFSSDSYAEIPPQLCDSQATGEPQALWYTCKFTTPPFMGCCKSNPCASGSCPTKDLAAARLSEDPDHRQVFLGETQTQLSTPSSTPTTTATSSSTQTSAATSQAAAIPSSTPADTSDKSGGLPMGAIVGIAVGGFVILLALIIFCIISFRRNTTRNNRASAGGNQITDHSTGGPPHHTAQAEYKSASAFNHPSGASHMSQMYSPPPPSFQFSPSPPPPHHPSPYPSPLHSPPYDALGNKTRVSHVSHLSEGSQRSGNTHASYAAYQPPPSEFGSPHHFSHAQPSGNMNSIGGGYGGAPQYSELPVEDNYQRRELQG
ncbi:hypothetical protein QBC44DRAFT_357390 [Cladorrhinum sp. PSN332]|nr:hypothetical protein QBC44DRAFT_357390 [Cladorrhinum sp. PSN332]